MYLYSRLWLSVMAVLKWIDYIWFVGESFHRREKSPGDGAALIM